MPVPKFDEFMKPLLETLSDGQVWPLKKIRAQLAKGFSLTAEDLAEKLPSGQMTVFYSRVGWAKTYLFKAGLIDRPVKAQFVITAEGRKVLEENPAKIDQKYLHRFPTFAAFWNKASENKEQANQVTAKSTGQTPDEQLEEAYKTINESLADELLTEVMKVSPFKFELMVMDLLVAMGYGAPDGVLNTPKAGDDGIDGIIMEDKLGFSLIYIQAKHWERDRTVGQPEIQSFVGAIAGKQGHGLFVTTAKFSQKAKEYAHNHHIILIDGRKLAGLMIEHNFCVTPKKTFCLKAIDSDVIGEYQEDDA